MRYLPVTVLMLAILVGGAVAMLTPEVTEGLSIVIAQDSGQDEDSSEYGETDFA